MGKEDEENFITSNNIIRVQITQQRINPILKTNTLFLRLPKPQKLNNPLLNPIRISLLYFLRLDRNHQIILQN